MATFGSGSRRSIENREHSVSRHLVLATEITGNLYAAFFTARMEQKWSRQTSKHARETLSLNLLLSLFWIEAVC
jgi:hypothetical protein